MGWLHSEGKFDKWCATIDVVLHYSVQCQEKVRKIFIWLACPLVYFRDDVHRSYMRLLGKNEL